MRIDAMVSIARPRVAPALGVYGWPSLAREAPRRGLTLLELLIVLTLIIATAAIAIPAMSQRFENTRFDSTIDQIVATLALSRAESQRQVRPVQVMWDPTQRAVYAAWLDQKSLSREDDADSPSPDSDQSGSARAGEAPSAADRLSAAGAESHAVWTGGSRLRVSLPEGCRVQTGAQQEAPDALPADGSILPSPRGSDATPSDQVISLIVYMPDGSTFGEASFVVVNQGGRQSRIDVNSWTGQVMVSRLEASDDSANAEGATSDGSRPDAPQAAPDQPSDGSRR